MPRPRPPAPVTTVPWTSIVSKLRNLRAQHFNEDLRFTYNAAPSANWLYDVSTAPSFFVVRSNAFLLRHSSNYSCRAPIKCHQTRPVLATNSHCSLTKEESKLRGSGLDSVYALGSNLHPSVPTTRIRGSKSQAIKRPLYPSTCNLRPSGHQIAKDRNPKSNGSSGPDPGVPQTSSFMPVKPSFGKKTALRYNVTDVENFGNVRGRRWLHGKPDSVAVRTRNGECLHQQASAHHEDPKDVVKVLPGMITQLSHTLVSNLLNKGLDSYLHQQAKRSSLDEKDKNWKPKKTPRYISAGSLYQYQFPNLGKESLRLWFSKHHHKHRASCSVAFGRGISTTKLPRHHSESLDAPKAKTTTSEILIKCIEGKKNARREVLNAIQVYHINSQARAELEKRANEYLKEKRKMQQKEATKNEIRMKKSNARRSLA